MRSKYSALPAGVSKEGMRLRWTPKSITRAPAAAPHRKTSASVTAHTTFGFQARPPSATRSIRLVLFIGGQRHQHIVRSGRRVERRSLLLGHDRVRRGAERRLRLMRRQED